MERFVDLAPFVRYTKRKKNKYVYTEIAGGKILFLLVISFFLNIWVMDEKSYGIIMKRFFCLWLVSTKQGEKHLEKERTKEFPIMKKMTTESYAKLLRYREKKCAIIEKLHETYREPVLTIRANYPGPDKNNDTTRLINAEIAKSLGDIFQKKVLLKEAYETPEGPTMFYVVKGDARTLKENAIYIEQNHELGRFIDIDVYDTDEEYAVGRMELSYEPRKCFLCDRAAKICSQEKSHSVEALISYMEAQIDTYIKQHALGDT